MHACISYRNPGTRDSPVPPIEPSIDDSSHDWLSWWNPQTLRRKWDTCISVGRRLAVDAQRVDAHATAAWSGTLVHSAGIENEPSHRLSTISCDSWALSLTSTTRYNSYIEICAFSDSSASRRGVDSTLVARRMSADTGSIRSRAPPAATMHDDSLDDAAAGSTTQIVLHIGRIDMHLSLYDYVLCGLWCNFAMQNDDHISGSHRYARDRAIACVSSRFASISCACGKLYIQFRLSWVDLSPLFSTLHCRSSRLHPASSWLFLCRLRRRYN